MMTNPLPKRVTIDAVIEEFLALQRALLDEDEYSMYRSVVRSFKSCVNMHAPTRFDKQERAFWQQYRIPGKSYTVSMSSFFGPEKMPREVKYFFRYYLGRHLHAGDDFRCSALWILTELLTWMVREKHIPECDIQKLFPKKIPMEADTIEWVEDYSVPRTPNDKTRTRLH